MDTHIPHNQSMISAVMLKVVEAKYGDQLIKCVQVARNYGRLGAWLRCEFLAQLDEDGRSLNPIGHSVSRVEYPHV